MITFTCITKQSLVMLALGLQYFIPNYEEKYFTINLIRNIR